MQGCTVLCKMIKDWQMMVNKREDVTDLEHWCKDRILQCLGVEHKNAKGWENIPQHAEVEFVKKTERNVKCKCKWHVNWSKVLTRTRRQSINRVMTFPLCVDLAPSGYLSHQITRNQVSCWDNQEQGPIQRLPSFQSNIISGQEADKNKSLSLHYLPDGGLARSPHQCSHQRGWRRSRVIATHT